MRFIGTHNKRMERPSCKMTLSAVLAAAVLFIGTLAKADQTETAGPILHDLGRKAQAYATGTVTADPGFAGALISFERILKKDAEDLPAGDARRAATDSLVHRSQTLRGRAANAPTGARAGKFWTGVGVELALIMTAAKNRQDPSAPASNTLTQTVQTKMDEAVALARAKSAALSELGHRMAAGGVFGAGSDAAEPPSVDHASAPPDLPPLGETWPSKRIPADLAGRVRVAAGRNGLDEDFLHALVWAEGGRLGDHPSGSARGPAQITRSAATAECADIGWNAVRSQDTANLNCSARILSNRQREYLGEDPDPLLTASLYNTKMKHWARIADEHKVPAIKVTVAYVTRISRYYCQITGRRLLDPAKHLDKSMLALSKSVDREMEVEIEGEDQIVRPGCSPY